MTSKECLRSVGPEIIPPGDNIFLRWAMCCTRVYKQSYTYSLSSNRLSEMGEWDRQGRSGDPECPKSREENGSKFNYSRIISWCSTCVQICTRTQICTLVYDKHAHGSWCHKSNLTTRNHHLLLLICMNISFDSNIPLITNMRKGPITGVTKHLHWCVRQYRRPRILRLMHMYYANTRYNICVS